MIKEYSVVHTDSERLDFWIKHRGQQLFEETVSLLREPYLPEAFRDFLDEAINSGVYDNE